MKPRFINAPLTLFAGFPVGALPAKLRFADVPLAVLVVLPAVVCRPTFANLRFAQS
ncbi:hypothetical protein ACFQJC_05145 [Haloferax namakaokahaiae]|uniref:Uncharacterized protein n=1 Tax=Haloferax namakaokahaiae TaxID=1748331 RepID=A0ABD5ZC97_9EURY